MNNKENLGNGEMQPRRFKREQNSLKDADGIKLKQLEREMDGLYDEIMLPSSGKLLSGCNTAREISYAHNSARNGSLQHDMLRSSGNSVSGDSDKANEKCEENLQDIDEWCLRTEDDEMDEMIVRTTSSHVRPHMGAMGKQKTDALPHSSECSLRNSSSWNSKGASSLLSEHDTPLAPTREMAWNYFPYLLIIVVIILFGLGLRTLSVLKHETYSLSSVISPSQNFNDTLGIYKDSDLFHEAARVKNGTTIDEKSQKISIRIHLKSFSSNPSIDEQNKDYSNYCEYEQDFAVETSTTAENRRRILVNRFLAAIKKFREVISFKNWKRNMSKLFQKLSKRY